MNQAIKPNPPELAQFVYAAMVFLDTIHYSRTELTELDDLDEYTDFVLAAQKLHEVKDQLEKTDEMNSTADFSRLSVDVNEQ